MKIKLSKNGYDSVNRQQAKQENWIEFNLIKSRGDGHLHHYDSWAIYCPDEANLVFDWCEENINNDWAYWAGKFYFKDDKDYFVFVLRWA